MATPDRQDQRLDVQYKALTRSGPDKVYEDTLSRRIADLPELKRTLDILRAGRLGR
jgi:hypothetical protein